MVVRAFLILSLVSLLLVSAAWAVEGDIVWPRANVQGGTPPAVFSHWVHRIRFKCYVCHDAIFEMQTGANKITMSEIMAGKYCGQCHDGRIAFNVSFDTCSRCHIQK